MAMSLSKIWKIKDKEELVSQLGDYIAEKCDYGDDMEVLSRQERIFFITQKLEMEVNNGGFNQFFFNTCGMFNEELVAAFEEIEASATAEICERALEALGDDLPDVDSDEWEDALDELLDSDDVNEILEECDDAFYEYEDDLDELNYEYVMENKDAFS